MNESVSELCRSKDDQTLDRYLPVGHGHLFDRSRPLLVYQTLFATLVRSRALRLTAFFGSSYAGDRGGAVG